MGARIGGWLLEQLARFLDFVDRPYGTHKKARKKISGASAPVGAPDREDRSPAPQQLERLAAAPARRNRALLRAGAAIPAIPSSRLSPEANRVTRPLVIVASQAVVCDNSPAALRQLLDALKALP